MKRFIKCSIWFLLMAYMTGCNGPAKTNSEVPVMREETVVTKLVPINKKTDFSYGNEKAEKEETIKRYETANKLAIIEQKPSYYEVYLDFEKGSHYEMAYAYGEAIREVFPDFALKQWLESIEANYKETLALQHIEFVIGSCPNCLIYSDLNALLSVASNIIDNAIKYGDGAYIHVSVEREEEMLYVSITNSGTPIPKNEENAIFKSFYRGSGAQKIQGNGLGLYICKNIIKELDGMLYVFTKEQSNQFVFTIPISE